MKPSRYSFFTQEGDRYFIYHQLTRALIQVDKALIDSLKKSEIKSIPKDIQETLYNSSILIDDDIEESSIISTANIKERYQSKMLRITILPTLMCNFSCWYCYENHMPSRMKKGAVSSLLSFIKEKAIERDKKQILLDWFGGEPLLCFNNIIVPFTLELIDWGKQNGISIRSMITTNGSLINERMSKKMEEIHLNQFQITLDGGKFSHNQTRYSSAIPDSYSLIIKNIHILCECIQGIDIELRINYTPENIDSIKEILNEFKEEIRANIVISPHIVWQKARSLLNVSDRIREFINLAKDMGYRITNQTLTPRCISCYTENIDQYVINYNLDVYKCTARDFDGKFSIGKISPNGEFIPNGLYYKYLTVQSPFQNEKCLKCEILPTCLYSSSCIQKEIEGVYPPCYKELHVQNLRMYIKKMIQ